MSATGLEVFDKTLQQTNIWLDEIMDEIGPDRKLAWRALGGVLQTLRDRLQPEFAVHFAAQLPLLVRGHYYEGWRSPTSFMAYRDEEEFLRLVAERSSGAQQVDPANAARAVFGVLARHLDVGLVAKALETLPEAIRAYWPVQLDEAGGGLKTPDEAD